MEDFEMLQKAHGALLAQWRTLKDNAEEPRFEPVTQESTRARVVFWDRIHELERKMSAVCRKAYS